MKWILLGHTCLPSIRGKAMKVKLYLFVETESHCTAPADLLFPRLLPQPPSCRDSRCEPTHPIWGERKFLVLG